MNWERLLCWIGIHDIRYYKPFWIGPDVIARKECARCGRYGDLVWIRGTNEERWSPTQKSKVKK